VCRFEKGWFEDVLPRLDVALDVVVLDVDLAQSTRTCVKELWPRLRSDGVLFSLDGQLRATHELLADARFWREEVGSEPPLVEGLGESKLLTLVRK
jgi:O-methyltransferase